MTRLGIEKSPEIVCLLKTFRPESKSNRKLFARLLKAFIPELKSNRKLFACFLLKALISSLMQQTFHLHSTYQTKFKVNKQEEMAAQISSASSGSN
jgi:hypothetical protein